MSARDARPRLAFLAGPPRSGTTWLQRMLGGHPDLATAQESHLFNHFLGGSLAAWDHLLAFGDGRGGIGPAAYRTEEEFLALLAEQVHGVLGGAPDYHTAKVFLDKTPDHVRHLRDIQRVVPDARIVLMTRRPADVIESMLDASGSWGREWAPGSTVRAVRLFRHFAKRGERDLRRCDPASICLVEYERLRERPAAVLADVLDFLDLAHDPALVATLRDAPSVLRRHGEFARRNGHDVEEPEGFARTHKGRLNALQRMLVRVALGERAIDTDGLALVRADGTSASGGVSPAASRTAPSLVTPIAPPIELRDRAA